MVDRLQLEPLATSAGYPPLALHFSQRMNRMVRRLLFDSDLVSVSVLPTAGISPGNAFAASDLSAYLLDVAVRSLTIWPYFGLSLDVDGGLAASRTSTGLVAHSLAAAWA